MKSAHAHFLEGLSKKIAEDLDNEILKDLKYQCPFCGTECTQKPVRGPNGLKGFCVNCKKTVYLD